LEEHRKNLSEVLLRDKALLFGIKYLESLLCRDVRSASQCLIEPLNDDLSLIHLAFTDDPLRPYVLEHFLFSLELIILALVILLEMLEVVKEFIEWYVTVAIWVEYYADLEQIIDVLRVVELSQLQDKVLDLDRTTLLIGDVGKYVENSLSGVGNNVLEHILQEGDRLTDPLWDLVVLVPQLDFLKDREWYRVDEYDAAINAWGVNNQNLLIVVWETEETRLSVVEGVLIVHPDIVLPTLIRADRDALLREAHVLLDVPDLEDPILVKGIDSPWGLIANHIYDIVML